MMQFGTGGNLPLRSLWKPGSLSLREPRLATGASNRATKIHKTTSARTIRVKQRIAPMKQMLMRRR